MKLRPIVFTALLTFLGVISRADPLAIGSAAPAISGVTDDGSTINLADVYKKNNYTLVWFYPAASTPGCTKQGCSLRDATAELTKKGVAIVGVSVDTVEKQKAFKDEQHFSYPLIADTDKKVIKAFGQAGTGRAAREAYLIDKSGKVVYHDEKQTDKQAEKVLEFLASKKS